MWVSHLWVSHLWVAMEVARIFCLITRQEPKMGFEYFEYVESDSCRKLESSESCGFVVVMYL